MVIDPGAEGRRVAEVLGEEKLNPELVVATHCHADHIGGVDELLAAFPEAQFAVGEPEAEWPGKATLNLSYAFGSNMRASEPSRLVNDGEDLAAAGLVFKVLAVPGHSPGSVALYCQEGQAVFSGDALFAGDIGRADLPGGDESQLIASVREKILTLPDETVVWPGHGGRSRVGSERKNNPYVGDAAVGL